ncbi:hypothetical protein E4U53_005331 [Claviceps sorghi]|nr:hypothetical protein E4U53_005331 [Claviceps sorghi]
MSMRGEMRELPRKPMPGPITTHPFRQTVPTDLHQRPEDAGRSRAVAAWLTLMESDLGQSRATPSLSNHTTTAALGMDHQHQPKIPRSRLSVMGATPFRTTRQRGNPQEPQQHPFEVSPITTASEHLPPLASASRNTPPFSTSKDLGPRPFKSTAMTPRGNDDELSAQPTMTDTLLDGSDGCTLSNAVAVTAKPQPTPGSKDMSAVVLRLQDQPVVKPAGGKRNIRPKIIAVRSPNRIKQPGKGEDISSRPKHADKVEDKSKSKDKSKDKDKRKDKDRDTRDKNKHSAPGKPETYRVHLPPGHANEAASNSQRHHDIQEAAAAFRLHQLHQIHHENILDHPMTTSLPGSTNCPAPRPGPRHTTLKHCLAKHPSGFDEPLVAFLARQILLGLAHLHRRGVTHRNVRTSTVFIAPDGTCKIGGLHHATHHDDAPSRGRYSPRVAPETLALQESAATSKLDIWDLGVLVLEMLGPSGRWCKHDVIRALLLEPMDGGILLLEKVDGGKMSRDARLFLMDCLHV